MRCRLGDGATGRLYCGRGAGVAVRKTGEPATDGARRDLTDHPVKQGCGIGSDAGRGGKRGGIVGRDAVDDGQPRVDGGAVAGIDATVDGCGEHDTPALLQLHEAVAPGGIVGGEIGAGDRNQAAALGEPRQRGRDVPQRRVGDAPLDMRRHGKWRVHQHDARPDSRIEMIVNVGGIETRDGKAGE